MDDVFCWGEPEQGNGIGFPALIVASYFDCRMEIANVVYVSPNEVGTSFCLFIN